MAISALIQKSPLPPCLAIVAIFSPLTGGSPLHAQSANAEKNGSLTRSGAVSQYRQYCSRCHGGDYTGSGYTQRSTRIPDFTKVSWQKSRTDAQLLVSILDGKGTRMPGFSSRLSQEQARGLVGLIRSVNPARGAVAAQSTSDFDKRFAALRREWDQLRRQFRELDEVTQRTGSKTDNGSGGLRKVSGDSPSSRRTFTIEAPTGRAQPQHP